MLEAKRTDAAMDQEKNTKQDNNIPNENLLKEANGLRYHAPKMRIFPMKNAIQGGPQQLQEGNDGALS